MKFSTLARCSGLILGVVCAMPADAQPCVTDLECPGDLVCEARQCVVSGASAPSQAPAGPATAYPPPAESGDEELVPPAPSYPKPDEATAPAVAAPVAKPKRGGMLPPPLPTACVDGSVCGERMACVDGRCALAARPLITTSLSVGHLFWLMARVTGEVRLSQRLSAAAIVGLGADPGGMRLDLGAQGRFYLLGDFERGVHVGGELLYAGEPGIGAFGVGPFAGYKYTLPFGVSAEAQLGLRVHFNSGPAVTTNGVTVAPILNFALGYSFGRYTRGLF